MSDEPIDYKALREFFIEVRKVDRELGEKFIGELDSRNITADWRNGLQIKGPGALQFIAEEFYPRVKHLKSNIELLSAELEKIVATYKK